MGQESNNSESYYALKCATQKLNELEQHTRKDSIRIRGIDDPEKEETSVRSAEKAVKVLKDKLGMNISEKDISVAHRLGTFSEERTATRSIIVKFVARYHKIEVIQKRRVLKGTGIVIQEDLTNMNMKLLERLSRTDSVETAWSRDGKLFAKLITGRVMRITHDSDLNSLLHSARGNDSEYY